MDRATNKMTEKEHSNIAMGSMFGKSGDIRRSHCIGVECHATSFDISERMSVKKQEYTFLSCFSLRICPFRTSFSFFHNFFSSSKLEKENEKKQTNVRK